MRAIRPLALLLVFSCCASFGLEDDFFCSTYNDPAQTVFSEEGMEFSDARAFWEKQIYDYGRGSKYNKPPIKALADSRLKKQVEALTLKCDEQNGIITTQANYLRWGCCVTNSSRPCLYPNYPYPKDPGGCVATVGARVSCTPR